ncbi:helix-turn-helix domain-containing protein [Acerihabitans sp. TG2]|uniref:helix-turn-helix domain-containing protein n=1 Tax=Acerihabitans sp. TG2 TaxID=3096008 RepID=UPI002B23B12B|nr:helix-turn-helix domain-containing protein [Acerihabitans sp. TG2]MEA9389730.1 helix-turn-helix domain-containing protein [Acerihabitans sp. TG2]
MTRAGHGQARAVRFSTLSVLCKVLNCQPGDILDYLPDDDTGEAARITDKIDD